MTESAPLATKTPESAKIALEARGLTKDFSDFRAVDGVDLAVPEGEIHAIIGPNGAGKTTLFNLLTGFLRSSAGRVEFFGRDITGRAPDELARLGLVRSFQISSVFGSLTLLENIVVALQAKTNRATRFLDSERSLRRFEPAAFEVLERVGLVSQARSPASSLSYGQKRGLEIGLSIALEPRVLLLDEPTSGMGAEDVGRLIDLVRRVAIGRTVVMVEHNMGAVADLSDRITVLQRGAVLASGRYDDVRRDPRVIEAYLGTEVHA